MHEKLVYLLFYYTAYFILESSVFIPSYIEEKSPGFTERTPAPVFSTIPAEL